MFRLVSGKKLVNNMQSIQYVWRNVEYFIDCRDAYDAIENVERPFKNIISFRGSGYLSVEWKRCIYC